MTGRPAGWPAVCLAEAQHLGCNRSLRGIYRHLRLVRRMVRGDAQGCVVRKVAPGDSVGPYSVGRQLGSGGFGTVYQGSSDHGAVALKVLAPQTGNERDAADLLRRELAAARRVDSGRIARPLDWRLDDDPPWIAFTLIAGASLADRLRVAPGGSLRIGRLLPIFTDIALALQAIHEQGVIHRDLKPANIQVTPRGEAVLLDLGVAIIGEQSEQTRQAWGTDGYRAPEQQWGASRDSRSDVWSYGVCLYRAATGSSPFGSPFAPGYFERLHDRPNLVGLPVLLADLLVECLHVDYKPRSFSRAPG